MPALNCINLAVINGVRTLDIPSWVEAQNRNPIAGSPLYPISRLQSVEYSVQVRIWARMEETSEWELVYDQLIADEKVYRLPAGFKSECWQVELVGNTNVYSIALADTPKALKGV